MIEKILKQQKPETAQKLRKLIDDETERIGKAKAEAEFCNLWLDQACVEYFSEMQHLGGGDVRLLYWNVDAVIKDLGIGDVNLVSTVLGNSDAAESYGSIVNGTITEVVQILISKYVHGEAPALFQYEVEGVNAIKWDQYPNIFKIEKKKFDCNLSKMHCLMHGH